MVSSTQNNICFWDMLLLLLNHAIKGKLPFSYKSQLVTTIDWPRGAYPTETELVRGSHILDTIYWSGIGYLTSVEVIQTSS